MKEKSYTCPYCSMTFPSFEELKEHAVSRHPDDHPERPEGQVRLVINGEIYDMQVEPEWTLYYVIHDKLGLTGVKLFCDRGACGACTVIMNGRPILSCMTLAIECDGADIETAEGIARAKHPLVDLYVKHHCMQCGYCTPGFIVTSKALLDKNPNPTEGDIKNALAGNLCRCGTYPQHIKAVMEASEKM